MVSSISDGRQMVYISKTRRIPPSVRPNKSLGGFGINSVAVPLNTKVLRQAKTFTNRCGFNVGRQFSRFPGYRSFPPAIISSLPQPEMPVDPELYTVLESRPPDEEHWVSREELFNAHGYNFRPRLRKDWVPSWRTTGENPLDCEDGEISRVPQIFRSSGSPH